MARQPGGAPGVRVRHRIRNVACLAAVIASFASAVR